MGREEKMRGQVFMDGGWKHEDLVAKRWGD